MSSEKNSPHRPGAAEQTTTPIPPEARPPEPEDVDALLADSLRAQSEQDFTWKEPERKPRWWERAEMTGTPGPGAAHPAGAGPAASSGSSSAERSSGPRVGQMLWGAICLVLALWVLAGVVLGVTVEPVLLALGLCTLAGVALVLAGLRPKPGRRI